MTGEPLLLAGSTVVGAVGGSFAVTAALRGLRGEGALAGRSHCDSCGVTLGFAETVPIISYLQRGGTCAGCGERIDPVHLVGELAGAGLFLAAVILAPPSRAPLLALLGLVLLAASVVDARSQRLPDVLTAAAGVLGATLAALHGWVEAGLHLAFALGVFALLEGARRAFAAWRGYQALGLGDVKLAAALALWLGPAIPWAIVLASLLGLAFAMLRRLKADERMAFGPMLALAAWIVGVAREAGAWPVL